MPQNQGSHEKHQAFEKAWSKIVAKCWSDEKFKERLFKDPNAVLKENGIELQPGVNCKISENTEKKIHLVLPQKPEGQLTEETLQKIAGGQAHCGTGGGSSATGSH